MIKLFSISLIFALLFNTIGMPVAGFYCLISIKKEMKRAIADGALINSIEIIEVGQNSNEIKFVEDNEFYYQNKLYDIISRSQSDGKIKFKCINDQNEEKALLSFSKSATGAQTNAKIFTKIFSFISNSLSIIGTLIKAGHSIQNIFKYQYLTRSFHSLFVYYDIDEPPPKVLIKI